MHADLLPALVEDPTQVRRALAFVAQHAEPSFDKHLIAEYLAPHLGSIYLAEKLAALGPRVKRLVYDVTPYGEMQVRESGYLSSERDGRSQSLVSESPHRPAVQEPDSRIVAGRNRQAAPVRRAAANPHGLRAMVPFGSYRRVRRPDRAGRSRRSGGVSSNWGPRFRSRLASAVSKSWPRETALNGLAYRKRSSLR